MADGLTNPAPAIPEGGSRPSDHPSRPSSTPSGFRNLRVLIPEDLHWRLRDLALRSRMTFQCFIVSWLGEAFPLNAGPKPPAPIGNKGAAPSPGLPWTLPDGPSIAKGPGAAQSQEARPGSRPDPHGDPAAVGPILDGPTASSLGGHDLNPAEAGGHPHV